MCGSIPLGSHSRLSSSFYLFLHCSVTGWSMRVGISCRTGQPVSLHRSILWDLESKPHPQMKKRRVGVSCLEKVSWHGKWDPARELSLLQFLDLGQSQLSWGHTQTYTQKWGICGEGVGNKERKRRREEEGRARTKGKEGKRGGRGRDGER